MAAASEEASFADLPDEIVIRVFSYLNPADLNRCSRVCKRWNWLFYDPSLWRHMYLTMWMHGIWDFKANYIGHVDQIPEYEFYLEVFKQKKVVPSEETERLTEELLWRRTYVGARDALLNHQMGEGVRVLELSGNQHLDDFNLNLLIDACPNLEELYANYTSLTSDAFWVRNPGVSLKKLRKLALAGCTTITDYTIMNLVNSWRARGTRSAGLRSLSLSGCSRLTDDILRLLSSCPELLHGLEFLDLSGCYFRSGQKLKDFVHQCTQLESENLFYCCNIVTGPYTTSANGCNNLDSSKRACCVQYKN